MKQMKRIFKIALIFSFTLLFLFFIFNLIFPFQFQISYSQLIETEKGETIHAYLNKEQKWRMKVESSEISEKLKKAFLFKEDKYFYSHPGINPVAIFRAAFNNIFYLKKTSGASTITMQVARLICPAERTYLNKCKEMFRALQLEWMFSKDEIFELYLNLVPYGGNIEGVKSAAILYYGRRPDMLSLSQVVTLTIIPNKPTSLRPGKNSMLLIKEKNKWLNSMKKARIFSDNEINNALNEPLSIQRQAAPSEAMHLSRLLVKKYPGINNIKTCLDVTIQKKTEAIAFNYLKRLKLLNIHNAAVIVIENKTKRIKAWVGSADEKDIMHSGEVDGVMAVRSPGSTLKPLVYALAMDEGMITPKRIINDVPVNFSGYKPENFNDKFNGKVTAEKALAFSLNVPAVKILNNLGINYFTEKLILGGFQAISKNKNNNGLSMVLGGCGVSLFELAGLYTCLANGGEYENLKFLSSDTIHLKNRIFSESAAYMITEILTLPVRPDLPNNFESSMRLPKIAWKTGTSYGRRDAWSIGYNKKYTIAVWVGNFDGTGVPELTGADMATPLLFQLFNSIDYNSAGEWFRPPAEIDFRLVCIESGLPPGPDCTNLVTDYYIPGISDFKKCTHEKEYTVSAGEKFSYCMACLPEHGYKRKKYQNDDPEIIAYYQSENIGFTAPPPHNPNCTRVFDESPPAIISPVNNKEYLLQMGQEEKIELRCHTSADINKVYWYINNVFYKTAKPGEALFFTPSAGHVKISCSDDKGRNEDCYIQVTNY